MVFLHALDRAGEAGSKKRLRLVENATSRLR
jgi:hypothetical protein